MKFIHTGDIHWGMSPDCDHPWSRERAQAIKETFEEIIRLSRERQVDFLLISGDLFHRQPLARDLKEINYLFSTIPSVRVVLIAGNHDRIRANSALMSFTWCPNVTFLMKDELESAVFSDCNTEIYGFSYHTTEITEPLLNNLDIKDNGRIQILLAHGGDARHLPLDMARLAKAPFSYIALGHIHKPQVLLDRRAAYCGSPEPLDKTETGPHGVFFGEINPVSRQVTALEFLPICQSQYISLAVSVTPKTTNGELAARISQEIQSRGLQHIYRFMIRGMRDPDITFDLNVLESRFRIVEIVDSSEPQYDFAQLFAEHPGDMIGFFIRALQKETMSPVEKKALYYGINALLKTTDERSPS
ncbi:MAG TPA: DNA repair exonuclease [Candidatus Cottocaccamicrobium excrementipullorum]|nr:DNA repair exonuclease [Candidatus Cottocaccamicrobium excrementipullorum]